MTADFLNFIHAALKKDGAIYIATDHLDYFDKIKEIARASPGFAITHVDVDLPQSGFELVFRQKGAPIQWLVLRKISPVR